MALTLLRADTLLDGTGVPAIRGGAAVLIEGDTIREVGPRDIVSAPANAEIVQMDDATILPGIVDGHVHLMLGTPGDRFYTLARQGRARLFAWGAANAQACLAAGLTTIFDCGGPGNGTMLLRDAIRDGLIGGPRVLAAGAPITTTAGHCHWLGNRADTRDEVVKATRALVQQGADFIKVMATGGSLTPASNRYTPQYSQDELTALATEAHRLNRRVVAHCNAAEGIGRSTEAGIDILAHCNWLGQTIEYLDYDDAVARKMGQQGMFVDFNIEGAIGQLQGRDGVLREWPHGGATPETRWEIGRQMQRYGVQVYLTSDAIGRAYDILPRNVILMPERFGEAPADLISRITSVPARALGLQEQVGTIRPGLSADLLVVRGDAERDLSGLAAPELVFLRGEMVAVRGRVSLPSRHARLRCEASGCAARQRARAAMTIDTKLMTADQLSRLSRGRERHELVRGVLRTMPLATFQEAAPANNLLRSLWKYDSDQQLGEVVVRVGFLLTIDPDTVREPDVAFLRKERLEATGIPEGYYPGAPDLAVEVVAPDDLYMDVHDKIAEWLEHGTQLVIVIDPSRRKVAVHHPDQSWHDLGVGDVLSGEDVVPGWSMAVRDLFDQP